MAATQNAGFHAILLAGTGPEKVVDVGIQQTLEALVAPDRDMLVCPCDRVFAPKVEQLLDFDRDVAMVGSPEAVNGPYAGLGIHTYDLEYDAKAFTQRIPASASSRSPTLTLKSSSTEARRLIYQDPELCLPHVGSLDLTPGTRLPNAGLLACAVAASIALGSIATAEPALAASVASCTETDAAKVARSAVKATMKFEITGFAKTRKAGRTELPIEQAALAKVLADAISTESAKGSAAAAVTATQQLISAKDCSDLPGRRQSQGHEVRSTGDEEAPGASQGPQGPVRRLPVYDPRREQPQPPAVGHRHARLVPGRRLRQVRDLGTEVQNEQASIALLKN